MAVLAVSAAGALIGGGIGVGANVGWLAGSIVGSLLFPQRGPDITTEGPRLGDLTVSSSAYGVTIPKIYGTTRLAGNMIWSSGIEEVKSENKQNTGKGGGGASQTNITYEYFASFALALCEGPVADLIRIWADGKLLFDKSSTEDDIGKSDLRYRFYTGTETQDPDSLIAGDKGDSTPAFRGTCYIVFESLPLVDFGNRIPNITVEVASSFSSNRPETSVDYLTVAEGGVTDSFTIDVGLPEYRRGVFFQYEGFTDLIRRINVRTMVEDYQRVVQITGTYPPQSALAGLEYTTTAEPRAVLPNGYIFVSGGVSNHTAVGLVDVDSLSLVSTFGYPVNGTTEDDSLSFTGVCSHIETGDGTVFAFAGAAFENVVSLLRTSPAVLSAFDFDLDGTLEFLWSEEPGEAVTDNIAGVSYGARGDGFGEGYLIYADNNIETRIVLKKVVATSTAFYDRDTQTTVGVTSTEIARFAPGDLIPGQASLTKIVGPLYDDTDDNVMIQVRGIDTTLEFMLKIDTSSGEILWRTAIPSIIGIRNEVVGFNHSRVSTGVYGQMGSGDDGWAINTADGEEIFLDGGWASGITSDGASYWDGNTASYIGYSSTPSAFVKWQFFRGTGGDATLDQIVQDQCERVGIPSADLDVTNLASVSVPGYIVGRQSTPRAVIDQLRDVFLFDGVESDYLLKFTLRDGKSVSATLTQADLAFLDEESGEAVRENITQDVELPLRYNLVYMDKANDYQQQSHGARRILNPEPTMTSRNEITNDIPIVLDSTVAKQAAERALFSSWIERSSYTLKFSWEHIALDPSDILQVNLDSGAILRSRFIDFDIGSDLSIETTSLSEDADQYTSTVAADGGDGPLTQSFLSETLTKLIVLCCPLLRDTDEIGRVASQLYYFMGGYGQPGWNAGILFKSNEGTEYNEVGAVVNEMVWGTTTTPLGDTETPFQTDNTNSVRVFLNTGLATGLSSATELEVLNGANAAAIVSRTTGNIEIIQFQTATLQNDGSYILSNLLRGRRGTELFTGDKSVGDTFLLLSNSGGQRLSLDLGETAQTRYYRAVTSGTFFEEADVTAKTNPANDLKPYAPVHHSVTGTWGSDVTLGWIRRTRVGGGLQDGQGTVPLSEDSEAYEIDIASPAGTVLDTITGISTNSYVYTSVAQGVDFPGGFIDETSTLLTNPSFESGGLVGSPEGWNSDQPDATEIQTGTLFSVTGAQDGTRYVTFRNNNVASVTLSQTFEISGYKAGIDNGDVQIRVSSYVTDLFSSSDTVRIDAQWLDADGTVLSTDTGTETNPATAGTWQQIVETLTPPVDSRSCNLQIVMTRSSGINIDIAVDDVRVEIDEGTKRVLNFNVYQISAQVGRGFVGEGSVEF